MEKNGYPILDINLENIYMNAETIVQLCENNGITVSGVIKGAAGNIKVAEQMLKAGCRQIASSRVEQLAEAKKHLHCETLLLRLPMESEIVEVVKYADISLNSELDTVWLIEKACEEQGRKHKVIIMIDLGDLREGYIDPEEAIEAAVFIEQNMKHVELAGVGTNLGCYGSVKPTVQNLGLLTEIAEEIEKRINRKLEFISGGATTTLPLVLSGTIPKKINNLRIGEGILNNMDLPLLWNINIPGMNQDTFILKAQIIEIKNKPSHPIGELFVDAFGNKPHYEDYGIRKRALLAIGAQDFVMHDKLVPLESGINVVGSSSDHLIVDVTECEREYRVGDLISFKMFYAPMLFLNSSIYVTKRLVSNEII
ncbi:MAG: alanine/ornithine racemase family PLP-dependent enzyme [Clostridia bacterium]|jgi:predicted amino acid racemase|nr:alanine/ornithine racemase family PLP-dependent enzyme [Clostridia bacterium]